MNRIPLLCISLLLATVFILQTTKPQTHVIYLASETNTTKVRPVGYTATDMKVVSAEEAAKRYIEANGSLTIEKPEYDQSHCIFNDCTIDVYLFIAKYEVIDFFRS